MNKFTARSLNSNVLLLYKPTTQGLPANVSFDSDDFRQPIQGVEKNTVALLTNLQNNVILSAPVALKPSNTAVDCLVMDVVDSGEVVIRTADIAHLH